MANPDHLRILSEGVEVWNQWRKLNPDIQPNLGDEYPKSDLSKINLKGGDFSFAYFIEANLREAQAENAIFSFADLFDADLSSADLSRSSLHNACLIQADLSNANLRYADLPFADLTNANLSGVDLSYSHLMSAHICSTNLQNADLSECEIGFTSFSNVDLSETKGLETVSHSGPSSIGIDTIYESKGRIPEIFLRRAGVPETFIQFSKSLLGTAIDFYSCFISFTESDDAFSERLYNDLQAAGVRCWRWKEDAKWGKTLIRSIDEAVRVYDKLVVICSKASLNSPAVIREIERALQKEDDLNRRGEDNEVLFPIRLDDYIFDGWNHHRKADVLAKNIGDFRQWKEPELYRKSLARLTRDLKA